MQKILMGFVLLMSMVVLQGCTCCCRGMKPTAQTATMSMGMSDVQMATSMSEPTKRQCPIKKMDQWIQEHLW